MKQRKEKQPEVKQWQVTIVYDGKSLTVNHPEGFEVRSGDSVEWTFLGIPNTAVPQIELMGGPEDGPKGALGPFTGLIQRRSRILAQGNTGIPSEHYAYHAYVVDIDGKQLVKSDRCSLVNSAKAPEFVDEIEVAMEKKPSGELTLKVSNNLNVLRSGSILTWSFRVPKSITKEPWVPEIRFSNHDRPLNHFFGPFMSLTVLAVPNSEETDDRVMKVVGTGNSGIRGSYNYTAAVVAVGDGKRLAVVSPDPVVDNRGLLTVSP